MFKVAAQRATQLKHDSTHSTRETINQAQVAWREGWGDAELDELSRAPSSNFNPNTVRWETSSNDLFAGPATVYPHM
jgi:hypothetical protein